MGGFVLASLQRVPSNKDTVACNQPDAAGFTTVCLCSCFFSSEDREGVSEMQSVGCLALGACNLHCFPKFPKVAPCRLGKATGCREQASEVSVRFVPVHCAPSGFPGQTKSSMSPA